MIVRGAKVWRGNPLNPISHLCLRVGERRKGEEGFLGPRR